MFAGEDVQLAEEVSPRPQRANLLGLDVGEPAVDQPLNLAGRAGLHQIRDLGGKVASVLLGDHLGASRDRVENG